MNTDILILIYHPVTKQCVYIVRQDDGTTVYPPWYTETRGTLAELIENAPNLGINPQDVQDVYDMYFPVE